MFIWNDLPNGQAVYGYYIPESSIPVTLDHVQTNYNDEPSTITYYLEADKKLIIVFSPRKQPILYFDHPSAKIRRSIEFRNEFPLKISTITTIGPLEPDEEVLEQDYVSRWMISHRAPRMFRNIWCHDQTDFEVFRSLLESTWTGMSIQPPERNLLMSKQLYMYCTENRMDREVHWAGYGFQVWLQLLTHIVKGSNSDLLVIDEPEIYLHPDLQSSFTFLKMLMQT